MRIPPARGDTTRTPLAARLAQPCGRLDVHDAATAVAARWPQVHGLEEDAKRKQGEAERMMEVQL